MSGGYDHGAIEKKWQAYWEKNRTFHTPNPGDKDFDPKKPKYYVLDMFPYPSGSGLHVGHAVGYIGTDIVARKKRMEGFNVLHPMGWDAFGLPAEQYAIQTGQQPRQTTETNSANFRRQLKLIGLSYDWGREINTSDPKYYKWTQWLFLKLYEKGLVYQKEEWVWWCDDLKTVLANEEVINGRSERGNFPCIRKPLKQWVFKITAYADRLLQDLDLLDWPHSIKKQQQDWIGKSEGAEVMFQVEGTKVWITVYTTRPDTIFGANALVLSPEHPVTATLVKTGANKALNDYVAEALIKSERDRKSGDVKTVSGVETGAFAINPFIPESDKRHRIPIYVADYVLSGYGTGALMSVPAHDERDFAFAKHFNLPITTVVKPDDASIDPRETCYAGDGTLQNSFFIDGMRVPQAIERVIQEVEKRKIGKRSVKYKLRDWLFSRQRYWGEPFPLYTKADGSILPARYDELPITLPEMKDFKPSDDGSAPLARAKDWVYVKDPKTGEILQRITDTMPGWAGSCWYYLRFMDPTNDREWCADDAAKYWGMVDLYVGGASHAVMHLLYARFWHKVFYDLKLVPHPEPFKRLFNQGMVTAFAFKDKTGRLVTSDEAENRGNVWYRKGTDEEITRFITKMAKSLKNVTNPDDVIAEYGADTLRVYEMFMGPLDDEKPWTDEGIIGSSKFMSRVWNLVTAEKSSGGGEDTAKIERALNRCLKRIDDSFASFNFNTAVAAGMEFLNLAQDHASAMTKTQAEKFVLMLSPFAPHICEELWEKLGHKTSVAHEKWPQVDPNMLEEQTFELVIQVNGKLRKRVMVAKGLPEEEMKKLSLAQLGDSVDAAKIARVIVVPNRLVNVVVKG
jgi:leucyl-tRNA synthetase